MTDSQTTSKRFETPILDSLKPRYKKVVEYYCRLLDKRAAVLAAGYTDNATLETKIHELFANPKIISAIDEFLAAKLEQLDAGRAALCERLLNLSLADIWDVGERVPYINGNGTEIPGKYTIQPKAIESIEPRFRPAATLLQRQQDGSYSWDNMAQHRSTTQLSKLMMWDQQVLDVDPPLVLNFGAVQSVPYEVPNHDGVDLSDVEKATDDLEAVINH